jgi:hypothetical protein
LTETDRWPNPTRPHDADFRRQLVCQPVGTVSGADQRPKGTDHVENLRDGALIERVHIDVGADERRCDIRLKIRKSQDEIGFEIEDLRDVGRGERRDSRLSRCALGGRTT